MINLTNARRGVRDCILSTMTRIKTGEKYTANVLPTRYGKSDVIRVCSILAYEEGLVSASLVLSPNRVLRDQIIDATKFQSTVNRYAIDSENIKTFTLKRVGEYQQICANKEMLISTTMQLVAMNPSLFELWVEHMIYKTGKPPVIFIDEAHTGSEDNTWGDVVEKLVERGAIAILLTATPTRSDGKKIPGFNFELIEEVPAKKYTREDVPDHPEKVKVNIWEGIRQKLRLVADHETTFEQAWREETICQLSRVPFDIDMSEIIDVDIEEHVNLSELPESTTRKILGRVMKDNTVVRQACQLLVSRLREFENRVSAIVFCGNDDDPVHATNAHAKHIRDCIEHENPKLNVVIATSSDGSAGAELIDKFSRGSGDVLIVKQMASLGLDIPQMKVCLDLSPVRTPAAFVQRIMRVATLYKKYRVATYISPADCVSTALFHGLITAEGGEVGVSDLELTGSYIKDRGETPDEAYSYTVHGICPADFSDTLGNKTDKDIMPSVEAMIARFPFLNERMTYSEIAEALDGVKIIAPVKKPVLNTYIQCDDLKKDINSKVKTLLGKYDKSSKEAMDRYVQRKRNIYHTIKMACGVGNIKLGDINDITVLSRLKILLDKDLRKRGMEDVTAESF